jgi:hypothetical protein
MKNSTLIVRSVLDETKPVGGWYVQVAKHLTALPNFAKWIARFMVEEAIILLFIAVRGGGGVPSPAPDRSDGVQIRKTTSGVRSVVVARSVASRVTRSKQNYYM